MWVLRIIYILYLVAHSGQFHKHSSCSKVVRGSLDTARWVLGGQVWSFFILCRYTCTLKGLVSQIRAIDVFHEVWLNKLSTCIHSLRKATGKSVCNPATSNLVCIQMSNKHVYTKPRIQPCFFLCIAQVQRTLSYMAMSTVLMLQSSYLLLPQHLPIFTVK